MSTADVIHILSAQLDPAHRALLQLLVERAEEARVQNEQLREQLARMTAELAEFRRLLFGPRSERGDRVEPVQTEVRRKATAAQVERLAEQIAQQSERSAPTEADRAAARRKLGRAKSESARKAKRKSRRKLPVVHEERLVSDEDLPEGMSREDFVSLGKGEIVRRVEYVRSHFVLVTYTLQTLQHRDNSALIVQAASPPSPVAGGHYGASVHAAVAVARCADSMPLHRIARAWARDGLDIAPSTVGALFHRDAFLLLGIYNRIHAAVKASALVHADETPQPTLARGKAATGWMWMACSKAGIVYRYAPTRSAEVARDLLGDGTGTLVVDGYSAYSTVADATDQTPRQRVACWAHGRRLFWKLRQDWPEARTLLEHIRDLYAIEHRAVEEQLSSEAHLLLRSTQSKALTERIHDLLTTQREQHSPASNHAKAIQYMLRRWGDLTRFLTDASLPLDNNIAERALRIVALGRKNSLFVGPGDNGQDLAIVLSVVHTCRLYGIDPQSYLTEALSRLGTGTTRDVEALLPWNWAIAGQKAVAPRG